ncbi:hypothetical protein GCM10023334_055900 [Nonomuraea thailandensis]
MREGVGGWCVAVRFGWGCGLMLRGWWCGGGKVSGKARRDTLRGVPVGPRCPALLGFVVVVRQEKTADLSSRRLLARPPGRRE